MAVTAFQRTICRLLADARIASGESYLAGGVALNVRRADPSALTTLLASGALRFHRGRIKGAFPVTRDAG
jgi:hypothetical protein